MSACTPAENEMMTSLLTASDSVGTNVTASGTDEATADDEATATGDGDGDGDDNVSTGDGDGDTSTDASMAFCGDSMVEGFELCDCGADSECTEAELDMKTCADILHEESGNNYDGGELWCNLSCQFDVTGCYVCGDGVKEPTEPCDGTEFGDASCGSEGFLGGAIACSEECQLDTSACTEATWSDDFETGDFSGGNYAFAGNSQWAVTQDNANSGSNAASSMPIGASQSAEMNLSIDFATAGTIAFFHKEGSESCCDKLDFYIDTILQDSWGGATMWAEATYPVTAGTHSMRWVYRKDSSVDTAPDKVWVDDIRTDGTPN